MIMTNYEKNHLTNIVRRADMDEIGTVNLKEMGTLPFFSVHYKGHQLKIKDDKHCPETKGDCLAFAKKYLKMEWTNAFETKDSWNTKHF